MKREIYFSANNGLIDRRFFLKSSAVTLGASTLSLMKAKPASSNDNEWPDWMTKPGIGLSGYSSRSSFESHVLRKPAPVLGTDGSGSSRTPIQYLQGTITPNSLHFERHHSGIPSIHPDEHKLLIHGLVDRPLIFDMNQLHRYPMVSNIQFLECSGNSRPNLSKLPPKGTCGDIHGMIGCSEWTGIPLNILLDEAGLKKNANWVLAEGADAASLTRSVPIEKAMDDAILALYQNGEKLYPSNGYPIRLFLPGYEGNISVKWLRQLKVTENPMMTREETSKYTDLLPNGKSLMFTFPMGVKSVITSPSPGLNLDQIGYYEISGIAWSANGKIKSVEVSADGGNSWAEAELSEPVLSKSLTRFRIPWKRDGAPVIIMSRATDEAGNIQPTRENLISEKGSQVSYHNNSIQAWSISSDGLVENIYV
jgi:sulfane dehydrogenase subunit SoxC